MKRFLAPSAALVLAFQLQACSDQTPTGPGPGDPEAVEEASPFAGELRAGGEGGLITYEITLENLTPATGMGSSQVFSPPVIATHNPAIRMFRKGRLASQELAQIAEDAVNQPMLDRLGGSQLVHEALAGPGVIPPGQSATYTVTTRPGFPKLSMAFMLVNTNDGFGGVDALQLPGRDREAVAYLHAYDAGSEENTELAAHIPGPCCGSPLQRVPTEDPISMHPGILGIGDLDPAHYGWDGPVAKLTVRRVTPLASAVGAVRPAASGGR